MSEEKPSLHIDTDWKRQAQEEKKRLADEEARKTKEAVTMSAPSAASVGVGPAAPKAGATAGAARNRPEGMPAANFMTLVQSILTQILFYLGDLSARGSEPQVNLDMAKHQIDMLGVLEEKTRGNLSDEEKKLLDTALYETRMRYVNVASQFT
jgi:hypothetical protein